MTTVVDFEHQRLARVIEGVAELVHEPDDCDLCAGLNLRRQLTGLADQIRAAVEKVNGTPHDHGPKVEPKPKQDPPPADPTPPPPPPTDSSSAPHPPGTGEGS